ncbi:Prophage CP4-57 integrase [Providencia rettgeri]|nr:Prophage integrase IntA [Providencia rettgeri]CAB5570157.1 Prophage CP4-57 integrase [Providencia rettgeri]CAC9123925.1 Prophage CP4-57 integrase [Providencia rettgeri]
MARQTKPLSVKEIDVAKPKQSDYVLYDGDGLELLVKSNGSKLWSFRYIRPLTKKRAKKSLGSYPAVSLADARSYRLEARTLLAKQIDPQDHYKEQVRNTLEAKTNTFQLVAERWWCSGQQKLVTVLEFSQYNRSDSLGVKPPLY